MTARATLAARKRPQQARSKATVDAILGAAAQVLSREGYAKTTTTRVAEVAGVSVGSLYQYFPAKESLVVALMQRCADQFSELLLRNVATTGDAPLAARVRAIVTAVLDAKREQPALLMVLGNEVPWDVRKPIETRVKAQSRQLVHALLQAHAGQVRPQALEMAAFVLVHAVDGIAHQACAEPRKLLRSEALTDETVRLVLGYLGIAEDGDQSTSGTSAMPASKSTT